MSDCEGEKASDYCTSLVHAKKLSSKEIFLVLYIYLKARYGLFSHNSAYQRNIILFGKPLKHHNYFQKLIQAFTDIAKCASNAKTTAQPALEVSESANPIQ